MIIQNYAKLYTGEISITLLSFFGLWKPSNFNKWLSSLYEIYSAFMVIFYTTFAFTVFVYFKDVWRDINGLMLNFYYFFSIFSIFIKQIIILIRHNLIIDFQEKLLCKICQPRDSYEIEILKKQSQICRLNGIVFLFLLSVTALIAVVSPVIIGTNINLPITTWHPYKIDSETLFYFTYVILSMAVIMSACTTASVEGLVLTFVLQTCAQLEVFFHRLHLLPHLLKDQHSTCSEIWIQETKIIADCAEHHIHIYLLGEQLNNVFGLVIFAQFFSSTISLCAIVYELTCLSLSSSTYLFLLFCMGSVMMQTFLYCFYGQKIMQKSTEVSYAIQQMDWTVLTNRGRKNLLIMMIRASQPIELRGSSMVVMSFKTFVEITKSAYSAYNLLSRTF